MCRNIRTLFDFEPPATGADPKYQEVERQNAKARSARRLAVREPSSS